MKARNRKRELAGGWLTRKQAQPLLCGRCIRFITEAMKNGAKTPGGERIKLQCKVINGQFYTRKEWVEQFLDATTQAWLSTAPQEAPLVNDTTFTALKNRLNRRLGATSRKPRAAICGAETNGVDE